MIEKHFLYFILYLYGVAGHQWNERHQRDRLIACHLAILWSTKMVSNNSLYIEHKDKSEKIQCLTVTPWLQRQINRSVRRRSMFLQRYNWNKEISWLNKVVDRRSILQATKDTSQDKTS